MNRLRAYRDLEGLSQQQLAEILGVSVSLVSAMESGSRAFTADLSRLGYAPERLSLPAMSPPMHRQRASTAAATRKRAQELIRLAGEAFKDLVARTPRAPSVMIDRLPAPGDDDEIEEYAIEVRAMLHYDNSGPIENLTAAAERAGVCLVPLAGLAGVDGLSAWVDGIPVVGLSPAVPGDRFRLTLAHELGHLALHARSTDSTEHEANRFAGALLFPKAEFDAAMPVRPQIRDFVDLKESWGVSVSALVYRAHELGYIDDARYRSLQIQMSKWQRDEPGRFEPAVGQLLPRLVQVNGGAADVATKLGISTTHLRDLIDWRPFKRSLHLA